MERAVGGLSSSAWSGYPRARCADALCLLSAWEGAQDPWMSLMLCLSPYHLALALLTGS